MYLPCHDQICIARVAPCWFWIEPTITMITSSRKTPIFDPMGRVCNCYCSCGPQANNWLGVVALSSNLLAFANSPRQATCPPPLPDAQSRSNDAPGRMHRVHLTVGCMTTAAIAATCSSLGVSSWLIARRFPVRTEAVFTASNSYFRGLLPPEQLVTTVTRTINNTAVYFFMVFTPPRVTDVSFMLAIRYITGNDIVYNILNVRLF